MTQPADTIKTWATDVGVRPPVAGASNVQAALAALSAGSLWVPHPIAGTAPAWLADGVGTWTFTAGVISQTNNTADTILESVAAFPATEFVIQADIRVPSGQDAGTAPLVLIEAGGLNVVATAGGTGTTFALGEGVALGGQANGDAGPFAATTWIDGALRPPVANGAAVTFAEDQWHTLRGVVSPARQLIYLDGAYVGAGEEVTGGTGLDGSTTPVSTVDRVHLGCVGLADFRNVTVWTVGLP